MVCISGDLEKYGNEKGSFSWFINAIEAVPVRETENGVRNFTLSLGQKIYTPDDIEEKELIEDDRPYAGYTFFGIGVNSRTGRRLDSFELNVGLVGPDSYARDIQKTVHEWVNTVELGVMKWWVGLFHHPENGGLDSVPARRASAQTSCYPTPNAGASTHPPYYSRRRRRSILAEQKPAELSACLRYHFHHPRWEPAVYQPNKKKFP